MSILHACQHTIPAPLLTISASISSSRPLHPSRGQALSFPQIEAHRPLSLPSPSLSPSSSSSPSPSPITSPSHGHTIQYAPRLFTAATPKLGQCIPMTYSYKSPHASPMANSITAPVVWAGRPANGVYFTDIYLYMLLRLFITRARSGAVGSRSGEECARSVRGMGRSSQVQLAKAYPIRTYAVLYGGISTSSAVTSATSLSTLHYQQSPHITSPSHRNRLCAREQTWIDRRDPTNTITTVPWPA